MSLNRVNLMAAYATVAGVVMTPALYALTTPNHHCLLYSLSAVLFVIVAVAVALPIFKPLWRKLMDALVTLLTTEWILRLPIWWLVAFAGLVVCLLVVQYNKPKPTLDESVLLQGTSTDTSIARDTQERPSSTGDKVTEDYMVSWTSGWKDEPELKDTISSVFPCDAWNISGYSDITPIQIIGTGLILFKGRSSVSSYAIESLKFNQHTNMVLMVTSVPGVSHSSENSMQEHWFLKRVGAEEFTGTVVGRTNVWPNVRLTKWTDHANLPMEAMRGDSAQ